MENSVIEAGKYTFIKTTYNDISVLIEKSSGYYNATKICKDNGKEMFNLVKSQDYNDMITVVSEQIKINEKAPLPNGRDHLMIKITIQHISRHT